MSTRPAFPDLDSCLSRWSARQGSGDVAAVISAIAATSAAVRELVSGRLLRRGGADLDASVHGVFLAGLRKAPVRSVLSPLKNHPTPLHPNAPLAVVLNPLDPARNQRINAPVSTIFSVLAARGDDCHEMTYLGEGRRVLAAGFVLYGPAAVLGLTLGSGTQLFVQVGAQPAYRRSHARVVIPVTSSEVALNALNVRHWEPRLRFMFDDLLKGVQGPYRRDFTIRWVGSLAADTYRILREGGLFMYPADLRPGRDRGWVYLLHQAQPVACLIEDARGAATDGQKPILDLPAAAYGQRTPLVFGSRDDVNQVAHYLTTPSFTGEHAPLFSRRSLFRAEEHE